MDKQTSTTTPDTSPASTRTSQTAAADSNRKPSHWWSFLERVGHFSLEGLTKTLPVAAKVARDIEPEFDLLFPLEGPVFNLVVRAICTVEMASTSGTSGETKLQSVTGLVGPTLKTLLANHNLPDTEIDSSIRQYINGLVAVLNGPTRCIPISPSASQQPSSVPPVAPSFLCPGAPDVDSLGSVSETNIVSMAKAAVLPALQTAEPQPNVSVSTSQSTMCSLIIDLSHSNGTVDLAEAAAGGIVAIIQKATQGTLFLDPSYSANLQKALAAGLLWGAYHFGTGEDGEMQARHFLSSVSPEQSTMLVLDIEANRLGPGMTLEQARAFVSYVQRMTGRWPGIYGGYYLKQLLAGKQDAVLANCWLWLAQYDEKPVLPTNWKDWTLWQFTDGTLGMHTDPVPGIGICDRSFFNGSQQELSERWKRGTLS
jgi:lysozyme